MSHVIYGLYDPRIKPRRIRYVGYTSKGADRRLLSHVREAEKHATCHRHKWIRSLLADGAMPAVVELEKVTASNWQQRERYWIAKYRDQLTNSTAGGEGLIDPSQEVRARIAAKVSASLQGNKRLLGHIHSAESRAKMRESKRTSEKFRAYALSKKGKCASAAAIQRAAEVNRGKPKSAEHRAKIAEAHIGVKTVQGYRWINDRSEERMIPKSSAIPSGFSVGRLR